MLRNAKTLEGFELHARDGNIGRVRDFFFDDERWTVRYLVVDAGGGYLGRDVLISPIAVAKPDWSKRVFPTDLTQEQIKHSPTVSTEQPVSREDELQLTQYYSWPIYWSGSYADIGIGSAMPVPVVPPEQFAAATKERVAHSVVAEHHLRSVTDVTGYHLEAIDGGIGHVDDFIIDDTLWDIRFLVVDTRNWWPGKKVLVSPDWINEVGWDESKVFVDLTRETVKASPAYDPHQPLAPDYPDRLHRHYGRPKHNAW